MQKSFITVTPDTGQNNGTLSVNADTNESCVRRRTAFKVEGGGITKSVSIEQDPNPYVYIDCGYIFSSANIEEPYELDQSGGTRIILRFNVKFANFISSPRSQFIIKNISSLPVIFNNNCVISYIAFGSYDTTTSCIMLDEFTTEVVPNSSNEGTVLSITNITPAKINEIVTKINAAHDASTTGNITIGIFIESPGTPNNLTILINVI